mgnify:CR=1 FL=1
MTDEDERRTLTWEYDIPLVNNLFMARDLLLVLVLSLIIMQLLVLLVGFLAGEGAVILPLQVYGIVAGVVGVLYLIAAVVVFWNRHRTEFTVGPRGVVYVSGARERRRNRIILALSFLLGRPGPALIATSQEAGCFDWGELAKVTSAITKAGGNIIALGTFLAEDTTQGRLTVKVEGLSKEKILEALRPLAVRIEDVRES